MISMELSSIKSRLSQSRLRTLATEMPNRIWLSLVNALMRVYFFLNRSAKPPPSYYLQFVRSRNPVGRPGKVVGPDVPLKRTADGKRDFSGYDFSNFLEGSPRFENIDYLAGRVRKEDMGSAALYAFGVTSFRRAQKLFPESSFRDQVNAILGNAKRHPGYIADIGCGLGSLSALFVACDIKVDAVDPSPIAEEMVEDTVANFTGETASQISSKFRFLNLSIGEYFEELVRQSSFPDTFVLVEAIEHIPRDEMFDAVDVMRRRKNCLLIVTNAIDFHPILPDGTGWNHVTRVDDDYYEQLSAKASRQVLAQGSHLVLEF